MLPFHRILFPVDHSEACKAIVAYLRTVPPVTNRVPGVTGRNQPFGKKTSMISDRVTPLSQRKTPVVSSKLSMRFNRRQSISWRPSLRQESP